MEITTYDDSRDLLAMEALYQIVNQLILPRGFLLSREQFYRQTFTVVTTCDGLLAITKRGLPLALLMAEPARSDGSAMPPRRG